MRPSWWFGASFAPNDRFPIISIPKQIGDPPCMVQDVRTEMKDMCASATTAFFCCWDFLCVPHKAFFKTVKSFVFGDSDGL